MNLDFRIRTQAIGWKALVIGMLVLPITGCGVFFEPPAFLNHQQYNADLYALKRANQAYQKGDYATADGIYKNLSHLAGQKNIRRKALFGLLCTRLMTARTATDMKEVVALWETWAQLKPGPIGPEDPRMLRPLIEQKTSRLERLDELQSALARSQKEKKIDPPQQTILREKDNELELLKNTISEKDAEIEKLKEQIMTLEAIDQNIQRKKMEISVP